MFATHHKACSVYIIEADLLSSNKFNWWDQLLSFNSCLQYIAKLILFMSFKQTHYWVTSLMMRSIMIYLCSRLTILVIQANSFYSASNIQWWMNFSSYFHDFKHSICFILFKHIVYILFCLQYISSLLLSSMS